MEESIFDDHERLLLGLKEKDLNSSNKSSDDKNVASSSHSTGSDKENFTLMQLGVSRDEHHITISDSTASTEHSSIQRQSNRNKNISGHQNIIESVRKSKRLSAQQISLSPPYDDKIKRNLKVYQEKGNGSRKNKTLKRSRISDNKDSLPAHDDILVNRDVIPKQGTGANTLNDLDLHSSTDPDMLNVSNDISQHNVKNISSVNTSKSNIHEFNNHGISMASAKQQSLQTFLKINVETNSNISHHSVRNSRKIAYEKGIQNNSTHNSSLSSKSFIDNKKTIGSKCQEKEKESILNKPDCKINLRSPKSKSMIVQISGGSPAQRRLRDRSTIITPQMQMPAKYMSMGQLNSLSERAKKLLLLTNIEIDKPNEIGTNDSIVKKTYPNTAITAGNSAKVLKKGSSNSINHGQPFVPSPKLPNAPREKKRISSTVKSVISHDTTNSSPGLSQDEEIFSSPPIENCDQIGIGSHNVHTKYQLPTRTDKHFKVIVEGSVNHKGIYKKHKSVHSTSDSSKIDLRSLNRSRSKSPNLNTHKLRQKSTTLKVIKRNSTELSNIHDSAENESGKHKTILLLSAFDKSNETSGNDSSNKGNHKRKKSEQRCLMNNFSFVKKNKTAQEAKLKKVPINKKKSSSSYKQLNGRSLRDRNSVGTPHMQYPTKFLSAAQIRSLSDKSKKMLSLDSNNSVLVDTTKKNKQNCISISKSKEKKKSSPVKKRLSQNSHSSSRQSNKSNSPMSTYPKSVMNKKTIHENKNVQPSISSSSSSLEFKSKSNKKHTFFKETSSDIENTGRSNKPSPAQQNGYISAEPEAETSSYPFGNMVDVYNISPIRPVESGKVMKFLNISKTFFI